MPEKFPITLQSFEKLRDELNHLAKVERPAIVDTVAWAASNGDRSENGDYIYGKKRLREIDRRIRYLDKTLENAQPVDPASLPDKSRVWFGATVTFDEDGVERCVQIVGRDESLENRDGSKVTLSSPIGRALHKKSVGDYFMLTLPKGEVEIEIVEIRYE